MKIYLADSGTDIFRNFQEIKRMYEKEYTIENTFSFRLLYSYFYYKKKNIEEMIQTYCPGCAVDIFLDSGAFSALSQGKTMNIDEYCEYIHNNKQFFAAYANLDVIGNDQKTLEHQHIMEREGLRPLPVFHIGSDWKYLEQYIERYPYIALGGMVPYKFQRKSLSAWILKAFKLAGGKSVFHGFGMTNWELMNHFPWYSVDSSSWGAITRFGRVDIFSEETGNFIHVMLGKKGDCYQEASVFRSYGFSPGDFADRGKNTRIKNCVIPILSFMKAERWLERKHGIISIPKREQVL